MAYTKDGNDALAEEDGYPKKNGYTWRWVSGYTWRWVMWKVCTRSEGIHRSEIMEKDCMQREFTRWIYTKWCIHGYGLVKPRKDVPAERSRYTQEHYSKTTTGGWRVPTYFQEF